MGPTQTAQFLGVVATKWLFQGIEKVGGCCPSEVASGAVVEFVGDVGEVFGAVLEEVGGFGEVVAQKSVGVLVGAALDILLRYWLGLDRLQQLLGQPAGSAGLGDLVTRAKKICKPVTYAASGGGSGGVVSGTVADVAAPFTLDVSFAGGSAVLSFAPTDEHGGTYSYEGSLVSGGGSYTIAGDEGGPLTLNYSGNGCAVGGQCAATAAVVTLTPND